MLPVAPVPGRLFPGPAFFVADPLGQLRLHRPLDQGLARLLYKAVGAAEILRALAFPQQIIQRFLLGSIAFYTKLFMGSHTGA